MSIDIHVLAERANTSVKADGFMACTVASAEQRLLAFEFDDHINSHAFLAERELLGMHAYIDDELPTVVIVRQP